MTSRRLPECLALDAYRLEHDWTWAELSGAMKRAGIDMSPRTLHYLLKRAPDDAKPLDRTLHKIRKFLKIVQQQSDRRRRREKAKPISQDAIA